MPYPGRGLREEDTDTDIQIVMPDGRMRAMFLDLLNRCGWEVMYLGSASVDDDLPVYTMGPSVSVYRREAVPQDETAGQG